MKLILRALLSAAAVVILSKVLPNVNVDSYADALIVAVVLGLLNLIVRPLLVFFTLPVTILTLGLFLLVINAAIIMLADYLIEGFYVSGWGWALVFSLLLSILQTILFSILNIDRKKKG